MINNHKELLDYLNDAGILICERVSDNEYCVSDNEKYGESITIKYDNDGNIVSIN